MLYVDSFSRVLLLLVLTECVAPPLEDVECLAYGEGLHEGHVAGVLAQSPRHQQQPRVGRHRGQTCPLLGPRHPRVELLRPRARLWHARTRMK